MWVRSSSANSDHFYNLMNVDHFYTTTSGGVYAHMNGSSTSDYLFRDFDTKAEADAWVAALLSDVKED